jgi:type III restriction enzyme
MATRRTGRPPANYQPDLDWTPTQAVEDPVLNGPYDEPTAHWLYQGGKPTKVMERRPASYWYTSRRTGAAQEQLFAEEQRDDLPLVNRLRKDVKRWRDSGYRGATNATKELFAYWFSSERARPLFFCQREAVETVVYLLELAIPGRLAATGFRNFDEGLSSENLERLLKGERPIFSELKEEEEFFPRLVDPPVDAGLLPLRRIGCKMATGSGKTLVMAMTITWAFVNRGRQPASTSFPNAVLVCAPNLTVKGRLQVLRPEMEDNYYDVFDLVPAKYRELLNLGKVLVTNWHAFAPKSPHSEGDSSYRVVDKGEETNDAFTLDRLGELAHRLPLLVLNDEGHHCWRPDAAGHAETGRVLEAMAAEEGEEEEARVWLAGLDRINNSGLLPKGQPGILTALDLSATPFFLSNSGYPEGSPFPWLVSDFGLVDAIESGIVKVPRLPIRDDDGNTDDADRPDPKYFRLWEHIKDALSPADFIARRPRPDAVLREAEGALATLASQWKQRYDQINDAAVGAERPTPPVLIVVCDNTEISELVFRHISGEREEETLDPETGKAVRRTVYEGSRVMPELANSETDRHTIRIDSKLLAKMETGDGETKDEAARALRQVIDTVGKKDGPGARVRCVVSVSMLTEGWDANNVTHVLGIRAFGSQLLCEQVVGRGLRRMNYTVHPETKRLPAEYVDVYGIPFSLIPFKGRHSTERTKDVVYHHIFPLDERAEMEIRIPVVESYTYDVRGSGIACDVNTLQGFEVCHEPTAVYVVPTRGYQDDPMASADYEDLVRQDRDAFYNSVRFQQVLFRLTQDIVDDLVQNARGANADKLRGALLARHQIFPEVLRIVTEYERKKVRYEPGVDHRELALEKYARLLTQRIRDGIVAEAASEDSPLLPIVNTFSPYVTTADVSDYTSRPVVSLKRSHLNFAPILSSWESNAIDILEESEQVQCFTPNLRKLGFQIHYDYGERKRQYEPDFVVKLLNGTMLVLEIKGAGGEIHDPDVVNAKNAAAYKWVKAVNNAKQYGTWAFEICRNMSELRGILAKHAGATASEFKPARVLPFRIVDSPKPADRYRTCVPLTSLRAAAGYWSDEQSSLDGVVDIANEWVELESDTRLEPGMFVARVTGHSMEPDIPSDSYCLFRPTPGGTRQGRKVLVWHEGATDPETGGEYTVKVYSSRKEEGEDGELRQTKITLTPINLDYEPIELTPEHEGQVRVLAEFVEVLGPAPTI